MRANARLDVAPGDGAFLTWTVRSSSSSQKSSSRRPCLVHCLGPDARRPGDDIGPGDLRNEALECADERAFRHLPPDLGSTGPPVSPRQPPEPAIRERQPELVEAHVPRPIALAPESQHRVRARPDVTGDLLREMNTKEGKRRIGHRIDQSHSRVDVTPRAVRSSFPERARSVGSRVRRSSGRPDPSRGRHR